METDNKYKYFAFISYKREDDEWASWIQHKLEHYKLPSNLNGRTDLPKEIRPIFKDTSELNPGNLPQQIHDALEQSKFLIVICSPRSAQSGWVNKEVETFIEMGKTDKIIPFIIDGIAFAKNPDEECFPKAIRDLPSEQEILGANIGEMGREAAAVKVVAQMFGLRFDELWQRYGREKRKKKNRTILSIVAFALIAIIIAEWIKNQDKQIERENWGKMENQSKLIAKKANELTDNGDSYTSRRLLLEILPKDITNPDKPFSPEEENALRYAAMSNNAVIKVGDSYIGMVSYSPDGHRIVTASEDGSIIVWNADNGEKIWEGTDQFGQAWYAHFSPDGRFVIADTFMYGEITNWIWDAETGVLLQRTDNVEQIHERDDANGNLIVFLTESDSVIIIQDKHTGMTLQTINGLFGRVFSTSLSPDNQYLAAAYEDCKVRIWDVKTGTLVQTLEGHNDSATCVEYHPNGQQIVSSSWNGVVRIWDLNAFVPNITPKNNNDTIFDYNISYSPDGEHIATTVFNTVEIRDAHTGQLIHAMEGHTDKINSVIYSSDGTLLLTTSAHWDGTIRIWDAYTGKQFSIMNENALEVSFANFSYDNKYIVTTSDNDKMNIWDVETKQVIKTLEGHTGMINYASFSPDGQYVVSASHDGTVKVWDTKTGISVQTFKGYKYEVKYAAFSPDGRRIITISADGITKILAFPPLQELIDQTRERFKDRPLTDEERRKYYLE